jgi:hypothetical protein
VNLSAEQFRRAPHVAADSEDADALAYLKRELRDSPWLDLSALRWRDNCVSLAKLGCRQWLRASTARTCLTGGLVRPSSAWCT